MEQENESLSPKFQKQFKFFYSKELKLCSKEEFCLNLKVRNGIIFMQIEILDKFSPLKIQSRITPLANDQRNFSQSRMTINYHFSKSKRLQFEIDEASIQELYLLNEGKLGKALNMKVFIFSKSNSISILNENYFALESVQNLCKYIIHFNPNNVSWKEDLEKRIYHATLAQRDIFANQKLVKTFSKAWKLTTSETEHRKEEVKLYFHKLHDLISSCLLSEETGNECMNILKVKGLLEICGELVLFTENAVPIIEWLNLVPNENKKLIISSILKQIVIALAYLQTKFQLSFSILSLEDLSISKTNESQMINYKFANGTISIPSYGAIVKFSKLKNVTFHIKGQIFGRIVTAFDLKQLFVKNQSESKFDESSTAALHTLFRQLVRLSDHGFWRNEIITLFFSVEAMLHLQTRANLNLYRESFKGDSLRELLFPEFVQSHSQPEKITQKTSGHSMLTPQIFMQYVIFNDQIYLPKVPKINRFSKYEGAYKLPTNFSISVGVNIFQSTGPTIDLADLISTLQDYDLPGYEFLNEQHPSFLGGGAAGKTYLVEFNSDELKGQLGAMKIIKGIELSELCVMKTDGNIRYSNKLINEIYCGLFCSTLYQKQHSPHFPVIYGFAKVQHDKGKKWDLLIFMEYLDSTFHNFAQLVTFLQQLSEKQNLNEFPSKSYHREMYIHNAIFQATAAIYQFHYWYEGMHNDLHLKNIMVKLCDQTRFGKQKLQDLQYFEYSFNGTKFKLPNLGFVIKIVDFGLSFVKFSPNCKSKDVFPISKASQIFEFRCSRDIIKNYFLHRVKHLLPDTQFILFDVSKRFLSAETIRSDYKFRKSFDLQVFFNNLATHPFFYRNSVTIAFEEMERKKHLQVYKSEDKLESFDVSSRFSFLNKPTFRIPQDIDAALTEPLDLLLSKEFQIYQIPTTKRKISLFFSISIFCSVLFFLFLIYKLFY